jgi:Arc/MetJ family transcription regulator
MTWISIQIDSELVDAAKAKFAASTAEEAVDIALRHAVGKAATKEFLLGLEGIGWEGDLEHLRG